MELIIDNKKKENVKSITITVLIVIVCSAGISLATAIFLNPIGLYAGGVTGIAQIILHSLGIIIHGSSGFNYYQSYLGILNFIFLLPFNVLAWFKLSKKYAVYTVISSIVQTVVLSFAKPLSNIGVFLNTDGSYDILACAIMAATIGGACNGFMMRRGATSGGIITYCQYLNLKKGKSVGIINLIISVVILCFGALISFFSNENSFGSALSTSFYTLISFILSSIILDYIHTAYNKVKLEIITEHGPAIIDELLKDFPHGITVEKGVGAYTNRDKMILNVIIQSYESNYYFDVVKKIDEDAFIAMLPCQRTFGRFIRKVIDK